MHHFDAKHYGLGLANAHDEAERRLAATEDLFDPMTFRLLDELALPAGARCLELGAGSGSVGRFLADQVEGSTVVVTDIDTTHLHHLHEPDNVEIREHDIRTDPIEEGHYDLIHARLLLEHFTDRIAVLDKLVAALRPGGWLMIEDVDMTNMAYLDHHRLFFEPHHTGDACRAITLAAVLHANDVGLDYCFGRELPRHLRNAGLVDVDAEAASRLVMGGSSHAVYYQLLLPHLRVALADHPEVQDSDFDDWETALQSPGTMFQGLTMVSAWGRRPAS